MEEANASPMIVVSKCGDAVNGHKITNKPHDYPCKISPAYPRNNKGVTLLT
ncbi:hypothetical protein YPC_3937 [Yersinia pestis biovar Medievalis str. Harbin 35]|uniref:Uncharacterized protein n=2 Tax=Yersinia pestis TaxID=632 RepID=Q8CKG1_YERPE|nr:hypothetical [Yersinia pestis KIM10+]ABG15110.1 conserved hypothetical protein [Yersinia pestis Antiqua]ADW00371.1 hypothetical protein YPC_3937 [Yersinia pestis biovar Medievalis str. Harbin 35]EEO82044.1 hypothetical protein YPF_1268 [Yersinia pestis biovar Orientalis str. India 195]EEO86945.1 hypothetical protein YPH_2874 [Yersinia pestis biovar Orientalis str. PEXU2]EEO91453.1 hypothetical protein YPS_1234 [Yersinia pestis Pestoides A]